MARIGQIQVLNSSTIWFCTKNRSHSHEFLRYFQYLPVTAIGPVTGKSPRVKFPRATYPAERHFFMMFDDGFFADPVQCGNLLRISRTDWLVAAREDWGSVPLNPVAIAPAYDSIALKANLGPCVRHLRDVLAPHTCSISLAVISISAYSWPLLVIEDRVECR